MGTDCIGLVCSYFQSFHLFPAISSNSSHDKPSPTISSHSKHFQPFLYNSSHVQPFPAIPSHIQPFPAIYRYFQPYSYRSNIQHFYIQQQKISNINQTFTKKTKIVQKEVNLQQSSESSELNFTHRNQKVHTDNYCMSVPNTIYANVHMITE